MTKWRKAGLWVGNGSPAQKELMLSWMPDTVTVIYEHLGANGIVEYKNRNPNAQVIVRFIHPDNWLDDIETSARNHANEIIGKWRNDAALRALSPLIYIANELNLGGECGDHDIRNQWKYETEEHYANIGKWFSLAAQIIKEAVPDIQLLSPPMAYGHKEDGEPTDNGVPKLGWAGYDYLEPAIKKYCDGNIAAHYYWGNGAGSHKNWLDPTQDGTWHAFRWQRVLKFWKARYGYKPTIWIDETGNFAPQDEDFTEQCEYYVRNTLNNPNIGGLTFFLWDDPTHTEGNEINSWVAHVRDLPAHVERMNKLVVKIDEGSNEMWHDEFTRKAYKYYLENGQALNDAASYGVTVEPPPSGDGLKAAVIGVHHLSGDENRGNHHIYLDALDENGNRMNNYLVQATDKTSGQIVTAVINKPENEPGGNIPMYKGQLYDGVKLLSVNNEYPSGVVNGITIDHPDEDGGNTLYHHSFFIVWRLVEVTETVPPSPVEPPISIPSSPTVHNCDGVVALSTAAVLLACGKLSEKGYLDLVTSIIDGDKNE